MRSTMLRCLTLVTWLLAATRTPAAEPGSSPFAPSQLATSSGGLADPGIFESAEDCGACHVTQFEAWNGSLHSRAHHDSIYLAFAELARKEGGEGLYVFCSSCHAPGAVVTGEIPGGEGHETSFLTDEGVTCDACHRASEVKTIHAGGGANASLVIDEGEIRYGPITDPVDEATHESAYREVFTESRFCSGCHTLLHPHNGLVIENTYAEWAASPLAKAGVDCQDCHMRTVEQAMAVAATRRPLPVPGAAYDGGEIRDNVYAHWFVGANSNEEETGSGSTHAEMARKRLRSAARLKVLAPDTVAARDQDLPLVVEVSNTGAGHAIPTSITELRQVWLEVRVADAGGRTIFHSGAVAENGQVDPEAVMYHAVLVDKDGNVTYLPWRAERMLKEKLIPAGETVRERYTVPMSADVAGPLDVQVRLRYRSAPQEVMDQLFGEGRFDLEIVDMAEAVDQVAVAR